MRVKINHENCVLCLFVCFVEQISFHTMHQYPQLPHEVKKNECTKGKEYKVMHLSTCGKTRNQ